MGLHSKYHNFPEPIIIVVHWLDSVNICARAHHFHLTLSFLAVGSSIIYILINKFILVKIFNLILSLHAVRLNLLILLLLPRPLKFSANRSLNDTLRGCIGLKRMVDRVIKQDGTSLFLPLLLTSAPFLRSLCIIHNLHVNLLFFATILTTACAGVAHR